MGRRPLSAQCAVADRLRPSHGRPNGAVRSRWQRPARGDRSRFQPPGQSFVDHPVRRSDGKPIRAPGPRSLRRMSPPLSASHPAPPHPLPNPAIILYVVLAKPPGKVRESSRESDVRSGCEALRRRSYREWRLHSPFQVSLFRPHSQARTEDPARSRPTPAFVPGPRR